MSTIRKEDAPCCRARALPDGRPVIGFCSPTCVRRPHRSVHVADVLELFPVEQPSR